MTPTDLKNIRTTKNSFRDKLPCMNEHGTKTTPVFLPADGEVSWLLIPGSVSLLSDTAVQPENTYCYILIVTGHV